MRRIFVAAVVLAGVSVLPGCGGGGRAHPEALYLTLVHQPLAGELAKAPDKRLLDIGHQSCHDLDTGAKPDAVVADIAGNPEPGSSAYNAYSFVAVAAADYLCPAHKAAFSRPLTELDTDQP